MHRPVLNDLRAAARTVVLDVQPPAGHCRDASFLGDLAAGGRQRVLPVPQLPLGQRPVAITRPVDQGYLDIGKKRMEFDRQQGQ